MRKLQVGLLILLAIPTILFTAKKTVNAQYGCEYGQYGGCLPSQSILIDKMVGRSYIDKGGTVTYEYVDNLSASDPRFAPGDIVMFQLRVKNTSNTALTNVTVKDYIPAYLIPLEGPGTYDSTNRTITFNAGDFDPDQEKVYYIKMQILPQNDLPADKGLFCEINKAVAYNDNVSDEDTAQFCIEKQVNGVVTTPSAGPDAGLAIIGINILGGAIGLWLKKRTI